MLLPLVDPQDITTSFPKCCLGALLLSWLSQEKYERNLLESATQSEAGCFCQIDLCYVTGRGYYHAHQSASNQSGPRGPVRGEAAILSVS